MKEGRDIAKHRMKTKAIGHREHVGSILAPRIRQVGMALLEVLANNEVPSRWTEKRSGTEYCGL